MNRTELGNVMKFLKSEYLSECTGHDWYHLERVKDLSRIIAMKENVTNLHIVELAALLHDIPDEKLNSSKEAGDEKLEKIISSLSLTLKEKGQLISIIYSISFKGGNEAPLTSLEAKVVRDADRLDSIGAIGIARAFAYGGYKGQPIYDPNISVRKEMTVEEYRNGKSSSIHHFYEKLLRIKDLMCTETGRQLAEERHTYMLQFLEQFYKEWNGQE
ncbi:HD domain-containing protein [Rossellomorea aquimaris]|uniref:HD domain-containing protein n=1 Tax=Rossellomorea aquimaris TaxID=189382 RepID=UPI0007D066ED|nr:HD domain-containing protein [Rossellomorea aquimaris]